MVGHSRFRAAHLECFIRIALAVSLSAVLSSCSGGAGENARFGGSGEVKREYQSAGAELTVEVSVAVVEGEVDLRIVDPSGDQRYASNFKAASTFSRVLKFSGERGRWVALFVLRDADGHYEVVWRE